MDFKYYPLSKEERKLQILKFVNNVKDTSIFYQVHVEDHGWIVLDQDAVTEKLENNLNSTPYGYVRIEDYNGRSIVKISGYGVVESGIQNCIHVNRPNQALVDLIHECFETGLDVESLELKSIIQFFYAKARETTNKEQAMMSFFEQFKDYAQTRDENIVTIEERRTEDLKNAMEVLSNQYGEKLSELTTHYEQTLHKLHEEQKQLQLAHDERIDAHKKALEQEYQTKAATLKSNYDEQHTDLQQRIEAHEEQVKQEKEALEARAIELDAVDSKSVRRSIRRDIKKTIQDDIANPEVSKTTARKRWAVAAMLLFLLATEITAAVLYQVFAAPTPPQGATVTPYAYMDFITFYLRQTGLIIAAVVTGFYYIKWQDKWSAQHADREFGLKQFQLDMERASWVVEMALEWKQETQNELPEQLSRQLTNNLFDKQAQTSLPETSAADHIASALLGSASKLDLDVHGQKVTLDRKGVQQLQKTPAPAPTSTSPPPSAPS